jgi:hypothetical protein
MQKKYLLLKKVVFLLFFLVAYNSYSQSTFTASKSGKWGVLSTWGTSATKLPTLLDNVNIASGIVVTVSANAECKDLTITNGLNQSTSTVSVESMGTLSIGGDFSITSENGNRKSLLSNYGIIEFGKIVSFGTNTNTEYTIGLNSTFVYNGGNQTIVEIPGPISYPNLTISGSGIKKYNINIATTLNTLTVDSGTSLLLDGTSSLTPISAIINGTVVVQNTASLVKGTGTISFNSGSTYEHSQNAGTIPTAIWNAASTCLFTGVTANIPTGIGQTFGNFTWDNVGQSADLSIPSNLININGDLSVKSTGANKLMLSNTGSSTLNVGGAFTMTGGTFDVNANTSGGTGTLNVGGDFSMSGTSAFTESGNGIANVNYNGTGTQIFSKTGGTISNNINFAILSGATVNFGISVLDGSKGTFNLNSGGSIITANTQGISKTGGSNGSIQLTGIRTYNNTANYTYNGISAQITGKGLTGANNLDVNNLAGLALSDPTSVSGIVTLTNGILKSSSTNTFTVTNNSPNAITGASATTFIDGPLIWQLATGQTYSFPIGKVNTYLPFGLTDLTSTPGTDDLIRVEAFTGDSGGTPSIPVASYPLASLSTTEYWQASDISGNYTGGSVSLTRQTALSGLDVIGRGATQAGDYTSLNGTVSGNSINSSDNTGNSLGFFVMAEKYKIFTGTISSASICEGTSVSIPYTIIGNYYTGNDFTAQLSDESGDFTAAVNIGTLTTAAEGTISGLIPIGTIAGNFYRIRVISSNPGIIGTDNGINLTVKSKPNAATVSNNGPVCVGCTLNLSASTVAGATYNWTGPNSFTSMQQNPSLTNASTAMAGTYTVTVTVNACTSNVASTNVIVNTSYNWTGNTNSDWNTASNWECNSIPNLNLDVIIPGGLTNPILSPGTIGMAKDIIIDAGATLTILDTLQIAGSALNNGTFNSLNGSLAFVGTVAQIIPANTFVSNRIRDLIIDNINGVSSSGNLEITGFLRVDQDQSTFDTGDMLTLISDDTQTALIDGSGNGQVVGSVKMQRHLYPEAFGYKYFSSPFSNTKVGDFSPYLYLVDPDTSFPNFYTYDENRQYDADSASTGWEAYTTPSDPLGILKAYALNFGDTLASPKTVEITGTVNNEYQEITLYNNDRLYTKGFNLVGNPTLHLSTGMPLAGPKPI